MNVPGPRPERAGRRAGWMLAGLALVLTGLAGAAPAPGPATVVGGAIVLAGVYLAIAAETRAADVVAVE